MSKEGFKEFASLHPELASHVLNGNNSWQQFYELYEIYGSSHSIWNKYLTTNNTNIYSILDNIKKIDMNAVEETINNLEKTIGMLQGIISNKKLDNNKFND